MNLGLAAIIITLCIIIGAVWTKRCLEFMIAGSIAAAIFVYHGGFLAGWGQSLQDMLSENVWVMLVCLLFGGLIGLLTDSRGSFGFSRYISKFCNTQRKTLLTTFIMGILIFVDDYLNVLSIGACMKKISDRQKLPRETLAYLLDSTGAPVCVLLPFSTWAAFYSSLFYQQDSVRSLGVKSAMQAYTMAIPYLFYPIITLIIVFLFCMGWMPKLGPMKKAYQRVEKTGQVYSERSRKYNHEAFEEDEAEGNIWNFLIPMGTLVVYAVITNDILSAVILALILCFFLYVPRKILTLDQFLASVMRGFADMLPTLTLLLVTFVLKDLSARMGMTDYIIKIAEGSFRQNGHDRLHHQNRGTVSVCRSLPCRSVHPRRGACFYNRLRLGDEFDHYADCISARRCSWRESGADYGCRDLGRHVRKPCLLLRGRNASCVPVCRH